jgi:CPA2 family monovalent cation:H+ antiporter-2
MSVITLCFAIAWLTSSVGLSLSLGAFLAGLILSESEYSHQALGSVLPFKDIFTSIFFISVGMLLDVGFLYSNAFQVFVIFCFIVLLKLITGMSASLVLQLSPKTVIMVGLSLFQVGEFSFILAGIGLKEKLLDENTYQLFLSVSVISMMFTPLGISSASAWADRILKGRLTKGFNRLGKHESVPAETRKWLKDHLIIVGFGLNGQNLARAARAYGIQHIVIETNPDTVHREKKNRIPIFFGDASQEEILTHAEIKRAKILVVAISDPLASRQITYMAHRMNPGLHIVVRTRYVSEIKPLRDLGAEEVIPEEFETSVEIFTRVLEEFLVPRNDIELFIREVRSDNYALFSKGDRIDHSLNRLRNSMPQVMLKTIRLRSSSILVGSTLARANVRNGFGVNIVSLTRNAQLDITPDPHMPLESDDVLYIVGPEDKITEFCRYADASL